MRWWWGRISKAAEADMREMEACVRTEESWRALAGDVVRKAVRGKRRAMAKLRAMRRAVMARVAE